jgi:hypothetical protein
MRTSAGSVTPGRSQGWIAWSQVVTNSHIRSGAIASAGFSQGIDFQPTACSLTASIRRAKSGPKMSASDSSRTTRSIRDNRFFRASCSITSAAAYPTSKYRHGRRCLSAKPIANCGVSLTW